MTNYTHNNHLLYDIGGRSFGFRENPFESYNVKVGTVDLDRYKNTTYDEELQRIARLVLTDLGSTPILMLSGGSDSELVARTFKKIKRPIRCVTIRMENEYNIEDVISAQKIANDLDFDLEIIDFDVRNFYNSGEALELGKKLQCSQIAYLMVYTVIEKLNQPAMMGGEVVLSRNVNQNPSSWYYSFLENDDASAMRFSQLTQIPLINEWFSYTPESLLKWLESYTIKKLIATSDSNYKLSSVSSKYKVLLELCPDLKPQVKRHGFENLLGFNKEVKDKIASQMVQRLNTNLDGIEYTDVIKQLRG